jgi:hypothetical protein
MTLFAVSTLMVADADARRKKRRKKRAKRAKVTQKANVKALRELMGSFKFGMDKEQVVAVVAKQIKERYAEQISATSDVYTQDKLRAESRKEIRRLKKSYTEFTGQKSGWSVSIIDDQFAQKTEESMMIYWEIHEGKNQRRFFFFHDGKLYKMFIALDTSKLGDEQKNFAFFRQLMVKRFGQGIVHDTGLSWRLKDIHVDALDKLSFYNAFCLVVTDPRRAKRVMAMREERNSGPKKTHSIIDSVTEGGDDDIDLDQGSDTIDRVLDKN